MACGKKKTPVRLSQILALAVAVALVGCSDSGGQRQAPSSDKSEQSGSHDGVIRGTLGPVTQTEPLHSAGPGPRKKPVVASKSGSSAERMTEKLSGYAVPGEYFIIKSRNYPDAVVAVTLPADYESQPDKKFPLVIAFGGAGECARQPRDGALAWMHYYKTDEAMKALQTNHLCKQDFQGLVKQSELDAFNTGLAKQPYSGMILACPYSPPLTAQAIPDFPEYEAFVIQELVPALEQCYRVAADCIGVDGVSMGGARSMYYGLKYPEIFSSIGSVQGAFGPFLDVYRNLLAKNKRTLKHRPIQLVTSDGDVMAPSVERMHLLLKAEGIPHRYVTLTGPHDYIFNQGPGSLSLLVFHNRALSRKVAAPSK